LTLNYSSPITPSDLPQANRIEGFTIYFGDARDQFFPDEHRDALNGQQLLARKPFARLSSVMEINSVILLHQVHGTDGTVVTSDNVSGIKPLGDEGDYLITQEAGIGIGVLTADCLPLIIYDKQHHAVAIVHAGWKGTVNGIAIKALEHMCRAYGTDPSQVQVIFGPAARPCCYQVTSEFLDYLAPFSWGTSAITSRDDKLFFDKVLFNSRALQEQGVLSASLVLDNNMCTMCNHQFYSHRRQKEQAGRNLTVVSLLPLRN